jgi:ribonuclease BN (tRNA processing enzyme)
VTIDLTVLGCAGSHTGVGRVCSGYLVQAGDTTVLLDAGNGSTANLQRLFPLRELDAVVISHRHIDHCIDLIGCYYNLRFDPEAEGRLPLYAAPEVYDTLTSLLSKDSTLRFGEVFAHTQVDAGDRLDIGPMRFDFARSLHPPPTVSTRIEVAGSTLVYSGDSAGGPELVRIARGADLFLCEATWTGDAKDHLPGIHLTAGDAARVAREAEVGRLVLTHIAGGTDRDRALEEAGAVFDGPIELADDLVAYPVEPTL